MTGWTDPNIIKQMDAVFGADKSAPADASFEAVCAEAERNSRSSDPDTALRGRLISAVAPTHLAIKQAEAAKDAKAAAAHYKRLADSIGFLMGSMMALAGPQLGEALLFRAVNSARECNARFNALAPFLRKGDSDPKPPGGETP